MHVQMHGPMNKYTWIAISAKYKLCILGEDKQVAWILLLLLLAAVGKS